MPEVGAGPTACSAGKPTVTLFYSIGQITEEAHEATLIPCLHALILPLKQQWLTSLSRAVRVEMWCSIRACAFNWQSWSMASGSVSAGSEGAAPVIAAEVRAWHGLTQLAGCQAEWVERWQCCRLLSVQQYSGTATHSSSAQPPRRQEGNITGQRGRALDAQQTGSSLLRRAFDSVWDQPKGESKRALKRMKKGKPARKGPRPRPPPPPAQRARILASASADRLSPSPRIRAG